MIAQRVVTPVLLLFAAIAIGVMMAAGVTDSFDKDLLRTLALRDGRDTPALIALMQGITWIGDSAQRTVLMVGAALFLWWRKRPRAALIMVIVPALASVTSSILKEAFARARPSVVPHLDHVSNLSFPSGHAVNAAALFLLAALLFREMKPGLRITVAVMAMLLIGISRLMLGVHYPSDVLAGWLIGIGFALAGAALSQQWEGAAGRRGTV